MQSPDRKTDLPAGKADHVTPAPPEKPEAVPTVPAPALDGDYEWDPERDPTEGLDPATTWWGG